MQVLEIVAQFQALMPDLKCALAEETQRNMAFIAAEAAKLGVPIQFLMPEGQQPYAAIVAEVEKIQPDLVIMGRRGKHGLADILMGSVTARVIGHSPVNVLVVPTGGAIGFQRILVASDGSPHSEATWELALAMAKQAESQLIAVAVAPEEGDILEAQALIHKLVTAANRAGHALERGLPSGSRPGCRHHQSSHQK